MYRNIGEKIETLAEFIGWAGIIFGAYFAYKLWSNDVKVFWIPIVGGIVLFILSWVIYGFGQLVGDVNAIRRNLDLTVDDIRTNGNFSETPIDKSEF